MVWYRGSTLVKLRMCSVLFGDKHAALTSSAAYPGNEFHLQCSQQKKTLRGLGCVTLRSKIPPSVIFGIPHKEVVTINFAVGVERFLIAKH
jgi:hypothetical protein